MELFRTDSHFIIRHGEHDLWCSRNNGTLEPRTGEPFAKGVKPVCLGQVYGIIGKIKLHPDSFWRLLLIKKRSLACQLAKTHNIYKIDKIAILPLTIQETGADLDLEICEKHYAGIKNKDKVFQPGDSNQMSLQGTWNSIKTAAENVKSKKKENKEKDKFEKRIIEELLKMFNDSDSFYYSDNYDITNSIQRQNNSTYDSNVPLWQRADERFFWNKHMLLELIEANNELANVWLLPVIQGYVQMENCVMDFEEDVQSTSYSNLKPLDYNISIISRRSRHRAGTRSRKRGLNRSGACANYVETEQIIEFSPHLVSFVQVRGSIPVFWSQSGFKYRPPPQLDKDEEENHEAFMKHFEEQLGLYSKVTVVSLAELAGKEHILGDAFLSHVLRLNSPDITYVTFDFHEYCRGMRFENVSILTEGIKDIIKDMRYCWVDNKGMICEQRGVLRVNCVDCLDRTNVVMTAVARIVMETQFRKLGLLPPEETLPRSCRLTYQQIWANNGDAISRQYAGTAALKGDFTRTGERKISGLMKDGMNSANRYYLRFRDSYRQAAIDLTLGQPVSEALLVPSVEVDDVDGNDIAEKEENVKMMIEDCKRMLIVEPEYCLGGWALINADPMVGDSDRQDMDIILLLSQRSVYVAWYDDEEEQVTEYQRIYLEDMDKIEIGMEPALFKSRFLCLRIFYHYQAEEGLFHTLRLPNSRIFNNKLIAQQSQEEAKVSLRMIADACKSAQEILSLTLDIEEKPKLERKKALPHPDIMDIHQQQQENSLNCIRLPRDVSSDLPCSLTSERNSSDPTSLKPSKSGRDDNQPLPSSTRSKSPLSFLTNIPKPNLPKPSFPKLMINPPSVKINPQAKSFLRKMKLTKAYDKDIDNEGNKSDNETGTQNSGRTGMITKEMHDETDNQVVMFPSCGILAASPKQLIRSSFILTAENCKTMQSEDVEHSDKTTIDRKKSQSPVTPSPQKQTELSHSQEEQRNHFESEKVLEVSENRGTKEIDHMKSPKVSNDEVRFTFPGMYSNHFGENDHSQSEDDSDDSGEDLPGNSWNDGSNHEEKYCITDHGEVYSILKKCHPLQHPSMKISLSDSSLSHTCSQEQMEKGTSNSLSHNDSSLMSRFKVKMAGLSKPSPGKILEPPVHTKNHLRKSQRAMEVFEQLMKEKLPGCECKSRFIFI